MEKMRKAPRQLWNRNPRRMRLARVIFLAGKIRGRIILGLVRKWLFGKLIFDILLFFHINRMNMFVVDGLYYNI